MRYNSNRPIIEVFKNDLLNDFRGTSTFFLHKFIIYVLTLIYTLISKLNLIRLNIKQGANNKFIGNIIVSRYPQSKIIIGTNCSFVSLKNVNLIGINRKCILSTQERGAILIIGNNCGFSGTTISAFKEIVIGNNVKCGANVLITDSDWHPDDSRSGAHKSVLIEDNVWLGVNTVVLKGVKIGKNTVIGANSVVTKSIPPNVIAAGNPCVVLRRLK